MNAVSSRPINAVTHRTCVSRSNAARTSLTERDNTATTVSMAFNYGGRAEIVDAVRQIVASGVKADKVTEKTIRAHLYDPTMPDPELMVRTSGEYRMSNFLLWELAYAELVFTDVLWPDFRRGDLYAAIDEYQRRDRRFGGLNEVDGSN